MVAKEKLKEHLRRAFGLLRETQMAFGSLETEIGNVDNRIAYLEIENEKLRNENDTLRFEIREIHS